MRSSKETVLPRTVGRVSKQLRYLQEIPVNQLAIRLGRSPCSGQGHALQDSGGLMRGTRSSGLRGLGHVPKQLKYGRKLPSSQLAIRLKQLSMQLSERMGQALQGGLGLSHGTTHLKYLWNLPRDGGHPEAALQAVPRGQGPRFPEQVGLLRVSEPRGTLGAGWPSVWLALQRWGAGKEDFFACV